MRKEEPGVSANLPWFSKNAVTLGAVAALSVGVLAACSGSNSSSTTTPGSSSTASASTAAGASATPITIGISLSLTGDFSTDGLAFQQGYKLWAKDVNAAGGTTGPPGEADHPERHQLAQPGRHQLQHADQRGPRGPDLRPVLLAADRPCLGGGGPQRVRVRRGRRRGAVGLRHHGQRGRPPRL